MLSLIALPLIPPQYSSTVKLNRPHLRAPSSAQMHLCSEPVDRVWYLCLVSSMQCCPAQWLLLAYSTELSSHASNLLHLMCCAVDGAAFSIRMGYNTNHEVVASALAPDTECVASPILVCLYKLLFVGSQGCEADRTQPHSSPCLCRKDVWSDCILK